jgi:hypothetical protein
MFRTFLAGHFWTHNMEITQWVLARSARGYPAR